MPGRLRRVLAVQDEQASVPGGQPEDHLASEGRVGRDDRAGQAAPPAGREVDHLVRAPVAHEGTDRAERLYLVRFRPLRVVAAQQQRRDERAAVGARAEHVDAVRVTEDQPTRR